MGHIYYTKLPDSQKWRNLVQKVAEFGGSQKELDEIARETISNVHKRFDDFLLSEITQSGVNFLVVLCSASKFDDPNQFLQKKRIDLNEDSNILDISDAIKKYLARSKGSKEHKELVVNALDNTLSEWYESALEQEQLFDSSTDFFGYISDLDKGSKFAELNHNLFSNLLNNYLRYFLDRASSSYIDDLRKKESFDQKIKKYSDESSSVITEYSARWFNKLSKEKEISKKNINSFLQKASKKIKAVLAREEE